MVGTNLQPVQHLGYGVWCTAAIKPWFYYFRKWYSWVQESRQYFFSFSIFPSYQILSYSAIDNSQQTNVLFTSGIVLCKCCYRWMFKRIEMETIQQESISVGCVQPACQPYVFQWPPLIVDRILDTRLWKHYLPQTSFAGGKNWHSFSHSLSLLRTHPNASDKYSTWEWVVDSGHCCAIILLRSCWRPRPHWRAAPRSVSCYCQCKRSTCSVRNQPAIIE